MDRKSVCSTTGRSVRQRTVPGPPGPEEGNPCIVLLVTVGESRSSSIKSDKNAERFAGAVAAYPTDSDRSRRHGPRIDEQANEEACTEEPGCRVYARCVSLLRRWLRSDDLPQGWRAGFRRR